MGSCCKEKGWVDERGRISYRDFVLNEMLSHVLMCSAL